MNIFFNNVSKYSINVKVGFTEYVIESNQTQQISVNNNDTIELSIFDDFNNNSYSKRLKNSIKNLMLNVSCTYLLNNLKDNDSIKITNEIYEFDQHALLLPFVYHYLKAETSGKYLQLTQCKATNTKSIKKIYLIFAFLGDGGFDFLLNIFSISFQMHRIKKLCSDNRIFQIISNAVSGEK